MRWFFAAAFTLASSALLAAPSSSFYSDDQSTVLVIACVDSRASAIVVSADLQRHVLPHSQVVSYSVNDEKPKSIEWTGIAGAGLQTFDGDFIKSLLRARRITLDSAITGRVAFKITNPLAALYRVTSQCGPTY